jgi:uncharacterized Zn finger protein (UPF0148 family)
LAHVVELDCPACGAPIKVEPEDDQFACSYCGQTLAVRREDGKIALEELERRLGRVERTALELPRAYKEYEKAKKLYDAFVVNAVSFAFLMVVGFVTSAMGAKVGMPIGMIASALMVVFAGLAANVKPRRDRAKQRIDELEGGDDST